jgi:hypothetical protein
MELLEVEEIFKKEEEQNMKLSRKILRNVLEN